jgi:exodeoxyribonuclease VII large subunit
MSKKILNVPFAEKDIAKALGAKWDVLNKYWYAPDGMDISIFSRWLPAGSVISDTKSDNTCQYNGNKSLLVFLSEISQLIMRESFNREWISAEISQISRHKSGHYYLELVQHNQKGIVIAKTSAIVWKDLALSIDKRFAETTNCKLKADIKVLVFVRVQFDLVHGLKLIIEDIDPAYTLGDMAVKLKEIRNKLNLLKIMDNNKKKKLQQIYHNIAVIAPFDGAGLGDFKKEAELLSSLRLCNFDYYFASFQGKVSALEIVEQIKNIHKQHQIDSYDMIVIIRGGGAVTDLAWLNDYDLAYSLCMSDLPVISGIGHRKDNTIVDEVANRKFDTPSKLSTFIYNNVLEQASAFLNELTNIYDTVDKRIINEKNKISFIMSHMRSITGSKNTYTNSNLDNIYKRVLLQQENKIIVSRLNLKKVIENQVINIMLNSVIGYETRLTQTVSTYYYELKECLQTINQETELLINKIIGQDPSAVVDKGFVLARSDDGKSITTKKLAKKYSKFLLQFRDGTLWVGPVDERKS